MAVFDLSIIDLWDELELDFVWNMSMMIGGATNWSSAPQLGKVLKKMRIEHLYFTMGKLGQFWWPASVILSTIATATNWQLEERGGVCSPAREQESWGLQPKLLFLTNWGLGKAQKYNKE